jgi:hypothetical protein
MMHRLVDDDVWHDVSVPIAELQPILQCVVGRRIETTLVGIRSDAVDPDRVVVLRKHEVGCGMTVKIAQHRHQFVALELDQQLLKKKTSHNYLQVNF